ncbi:hypothetical protein cyc_07475 [Cyclospora cayetanensis]|uniref:Cyclin N-terminal domain-containing protein n=1 Tax=Cyclospora cayetanensis TaxID=88456 RepID=A0A1D3D0Y4_9EIME|nr:hypothetical protein cyc_07475 [Cyclospora cayetanensis]
MPGSVLGGGPWCNSCRLPLIVFRRLLALALASPHSSRHRPSSRRGPLLPLHHEPTRQSPSPGVAAAARNLETVGAPSRESPIEPEGGSAPLHGSHEKRRRSRPSLHKAAKLSPCKKACKRPAAAAASHSPLCAGSSPLEAAACLRNPCSGEAAEVALLVEGSEQLALTQQEAIAKYIRLLNLTSCASFHWDLLYAGDRLREERERGPPLLGAPKEGSVGTPLGGSEAGRRAAVVDIIMSYAADLQRCFGGAACDVARVSVQLAVSILDRSGLLRKAKKDPQAVRCCAAFCLSLALQHEAPNSMALEGKLKKLLLLERLVPESFGVSFGELQRQVLDCLHCRVAAPLPIDFASYLLYETAAFGGAPGGPSASTVELVCYLLDCFSLTPEAAVTPASLAAAAAVELARRIAYADREAPIGGGGGLRTGD